MKASVRDLNNEPTKEVELPGIFSAPLRSDVVARAFWILNSHGLQPYGRDPMAGMRTTAETSNPPTGRGISRIPRVKGDRHPRGGQAAGVASVVKGRLPHPPKSEKVIYRKINRKERHLAMAHAIAFTANAGAVSARGHRIGNLQLPVVVTDELEGVSRTAELRSFLEKLGLGEEARRIYGGVKANSGKPRMRGRAYRSKVGPLVVVTNDRGVGKAAGAIPGVEVVPIDSLNVLQLAPGGVPGRLVIWTESSLDGVKAMEKNREVELKVAT